MQRTSEEMWGRKLPEALITNLYKYAFEQLRPNMCFVVEWFKEDLPLEDADGSSIVGLLNMDPPPASQGPTPLPPVLPSVEIPASPAQDVLVFSDSYGYCNDIMETAPPGRIRSSKTVSKPPAKLTQQDVKEILGRGFDLVIYAYGIDTPPSNSVEDIMEHQDAVAKVFFYLLKEISLSANACKRLACLTCDAFSNDPEVHEENGLGVVTHSTLYGMCNVARLELDIPVQYIDTEWALLKENVPKLASDIFRVETFGHDTLRILNEGRYIYRKMLAAPYEKRFADFEFPGRGIIAITGGNGSLAQVMGGWVLHRVGQAHGWRADRKDLCIKFLSRSCKVSDQNMAGWKAIQAGAEALNITVEQCRCDVSDRASVDSFIAECSPNLTAFIHTAGILHDAMLLNVTWADFDEVWNPKSRGALYLHDALERHSNPDLNVFLMFSSMSVYGDMGQTNYAASNAFLDGLARHRQALGKPAVAMQFGGWGEAGMAANMSEPLKARAAAGPRPFFTNTEGIWGIETGLRTGLPHFAVLRYNPEVQAHLNRAELSTTQIYLRNWLSEFLPLEPPAPGQVDRKNLFKLYRAQQDEAREAVFCRDLSSTLVFGKLVEPWLSEEARWELAGREIPWDVQRPLPLGGSA
uniref:Type I polyketide synthase ketoyl reductase domain protein n=1 Tax=Gambierdiscus polynesiensis TaxID=439318 RepID=A0A1S6K858_9DINO|nr:type I polyketide synthase ketoyl reductase domain protein [Gambierdiscus polynesiensis]